MLEYKFQLDSLVRTHSIQLTICILNSDLCKVQLAPHVLEQNNHVSGGKSVCNIYLAEKCC